MIPILFDATETTFTSNGIGRLTDAVSCLVTEERNGQYELVMQYPIDGEMFGEIACGKYIFATHDESKTPQAFQIYRISAPLEGVVTINAWHISYALNTIIVEPFTAGSCTAAIAGVKTHSMNTNPFTFSTDKQVTADFELTIPASARAVLGGMSGSILDVYGKGEYEFDMYAVKLYLNRGQNRGVSIRYGKNLAKLDQTLDASNVYNSVVPYWTNGETTVVSDAIITRTGESVGNTISLDLSTYFMDEPTVAELKAKAQTIVDASEDYTLKENVKVDFVALWQTEEYKNYAALERVFLCDTVNIFYEKLGVNVTAKVIKVVYDTLRERYASIELGEPTTSLYQQIQTSVVNNVLEVVPSKSQMQSAIDHATELIGGGFGGYIKFKYLSDGTPSEMLVMDSPDESTAVNIIRLNQNGLGFSTDGGSTYANAWTIDGNLNASFITTGVLDADLMTAGMIQDSSGENYWNLDTGQFVTKQGTIADFTIDQTSLRNGTVGQGTDGTSITEGQWESTKTGTMTSSGVSYQYTTKVKMSNRGISMYSSRDDVDTDLVQVLQIEPHVWVVNGTPRHNVYFSTSAADGYLFAVSKASEYSATAYPLDVYQRTDFRKAVKFDEDVQIGTDLTNANLDVHGQILSQKATGDGLNSAIVAKSATNAAVAAYNVANNNFIELCDGSSGNRGLYTADQGWVFRLDPNDNNIYFGSYNILTTKTVSRSRKSATSAVNISANSQSSVTIDASRSGYTVLGIVGITNTGGTGLAVSDFYLSGDTVYIYFSNPTSSSKTVTWYADILYI